MVKAVPFKAFRYDPNVVGDLSKVVAPPYDVIKGKKVDEIQGLSPYNIAWVTKNKPQDGDTPNKNQYTRAKEFMEKWLKEGALKQDPKECFYIYGQNFKVGDKDLFRYGFIGLLELEEFGKGSPKGVPFTGVLQHEETLPKDILDRLSLYRQTHVQEGQIFVIYPDHEGKVDSILERYMKQKPAIDVYDADGVRDRIWIVDADADIRQIAAVMKDKYVIIADGHHRYKTALAFRDENPKNAAAKFRMMTFVNIANSGLVILPTHRLVQNLENFSGAVLLKKAGEHFVIKDYKTKNGMFKNMEKAFSEGKHAFGLFMNDGNYYSMILKDESVMTKMLPDKSAQLAKLDVSILHSLLLDRILGIDKEKLLHGTMTGGGYVVYIKGIGDAVDEAIESVQKGAQAVFFMNPTRIGEVEGVARNFECMPQKSTFFHPKVWTGFTFNKV